MSSSPAKPPPAPPKSVYNMASQYAFATHAPPPLHPLDMSLNLQHDHKDLVQCVTFNTYGDRLATGSVDGRIRVFNRHRDAVWRLADKWTAHASEVLELQWLPAAVYPNLLASLGADGRFKLWAEDPAAAPGRRFHGGAGSAGGAGGGSGSGSGSGGGSGASGISGINSGSTSSQFYQQQQQQQQNYYNINNNSSNNSFSNSNSYSHQTSTSASGGGGGGSYTRLSGNDGDSVGKPVYETRSASARAPYRSFSMRHDEATGLTHLALLASDGRLTVLENDEPENLSESTLLDDFSVLGPAARSPARGAEVSFKVRFDPNAEPCYAALRAGVAQDALGLVVASMTSVRIFRTRDLASGTTRASGIGGSGSGGSSSAGSARRFYCAVAIENHRGLVRDVSWAMGNIRGHDVVATACQDGLVRVFRIDTPTDDDDDERSWAVADVTQHTQPHRRAGLDSSSAGTATPRLPGSSLGERQAPAAPHHTSGLSASFARSSAGEGAESAAPPDLRTVPAAGPLPPGMVRHAVREVARLDCHGTPVWRVGFDDDGQVLGSSGDDGRLMCYRQTPDGGWAKSSELAMMKTRMAAP